VPLASVSIKKPVAISMFYIGVALLGIYSFTRLGVDLLPNINMPHLMVQTSYPNATPEEVELQVTERLEAQIGTVPGVKKIKSVSKEGMSVISVDFDWGTDMKYAFLSMREKLDNASFTNTEIGRPVIVKSDPTSSPIMTLVLTMKSEKKDSTQKYIDEKSGGIKFVDHDAHYSEIEKLIKLKEDARSFFKRRFEQIDGLAQAVITGGLEREVLVETDPKKLEKYEISFSQINSALSGANVNQSAGQIIKGTFRLPLRSIGEYQNIKEIEETVVAHNKYGGVIRIKDVGQVRENFKDREGLTRLNGSETVGFLIYKESTANTVTVAAQARELVEKLKKEKSDYNLTIVSDNSSFIESAISNVNQEVYIGGLLAVMVLFFFLGSLRHIFIIGITIPSSLVLTILLMYLFDINFNIISLGGMAVGVGMLLDNAIVVIENVVTYCEKGLSLKDAALRGTNEVAMPVVAATLTTMVVFLPLLFIKGIAGELFRDQSLAIAFSLASSIITAITLIPMLAARKKYVSFDREHYNGKFIEFKSPKEKKFFGKIGFWICFPVVFFFKTIFFFSVKAGLKVSDLFQKGFAKAFARVDVFMEWIIHKYEKLLLWALDNRGKVVAVTVVLIVLTVMAAIDIKKEFIPASSSDEFIVELNYVPGTSLKGNAEYTSAVEKEILKIKGVANLVSNIGRVNEFDFLNKEQINVNTTNLNLKLNSYDDYDSVQAEVRKILDKKPELTYAFKQVKNAYTQIIQPSDNDLVITVKNRSLEKALAKGNLIVEELKKANLDGIVNIRLAMEKGTPQYNIAVDKEKCMNYDIPVNLVSDQIVSSVKGKTATTFSDFDKKVSVNVKTTEESRDNIEDVLSNYVVSDKKKVPIRDLVNYQLVNSYNEIFRDEQARAIYIYADLKNKSVELAVEEMQKVINKIHSEADENITVGGTNDEIRASFGGLYVALIISILLMYMILAAEFESFLFPFIIIFSVPLGLIGGILLLYVLGESISIISLLGLIILIGIADNDAVVKVEYILRMRKEGLSVRDSIYAAGHARFRPIVMNTFTVVFGLIPMMMGLGAGTQLRIGLSIAVVGGLLSSTFLTLIIIPVLYTYLERFTRKDFNELVKD
jgi:hydrophobic/amphiphilic exporter-1 (mainly G- bacteria), HAE1 family